MLSLGIENRLIINNKLKFDSISIAEGSVEVTQINTNFYLTPKTVANVAIVFHRKEKPIDSARFWVKDIFEPQLSFRFRTHEDKSISKRIFTGNNVLSGILNPDLASGLHIYSTVESFSVLISDENNQMIMQENIIGDQLSTKMREEIVQNKAVKQILFYNVKVEKRENYIQPVQFELEEPQLD